MIHHQLLPVTGFSAFLFPVGLFCISVVIDLFDYLLLNLTVELLLAYKRTTYV